MRNKIATMAAAAVLAAQLSPAGTARVGAEPPAPTAVAVDPHVITLVTGDRVTYTGSGAKLRIVSTVPGADRRPTVYATLHDQGDWYVIPADAWRGVADGSIDRSLFDITLLARDRLDDAHRGQVRVLVSGASGRASSAAHVAGRIAETTAMPQLQMSAMAAAKSHAASLWRDLTMRGRLRPSIGSHLWLDAPVHATLDQSVPLIGAPTAWQHGWTGKGVKVAVLDSGIDAQHPDLRGAVIAQRNFTESRTVTDRAGHGTHVASIITGSGAASNGRYKGVAPGVRLLSGKVLDDSGFGFDSEILAGMNWAVAHGARIVSMSLGGSPSNGRDVLSRAVDQLSASTGTLFVIAAGNEGPAGAVESPGAATAALTVASTTKQDTLSYFSSAGPRIGDFGTKPDIAAPGSDIVAARAPGTLAAEAVDKYYAKLSGTSMATPHVAGAAAILAGEHPNWTGHQIKAALMSSAKVLPGIDVFGDGAGRVDIAAAVTDHVRALTPDAAFDTITAGADATRTVRYANDSDRRVQLSLSLRIGRRDGAAAPDGLFTLGRSSLTVPAHGIASALITLHSADSVIGGYGGRLLATGDGTTLSTPVAGKVSTPKSTVTVNVLDRDGQPVTADNVITALQSETTGEMALLSDVDGRLNASVPQGTYRLVGGYLGYGRTDLPTSYTHFDRGAVVVTGDSTVTVDTASAGPATATLNQRGAEPEALDAQFATVSQVDGSAQQSEVAFASNFGTQFASLPQALPGVAFVYLADWIRPPQVVQIAAPDGYRASNVVDNSPTGWHGNITAPLVDIGESTDAADLPDVNGKVVLFAPPVLRGVRPGRPPSNRAIERLVHTLHDRGALLLLSYDFVPDTSTVPVLQLFDSNDVQGLRDDIAAGQSTINVVGRRTSPYLYALYQATSDAVPNGITLPFTKTELGRVEATYRQPTARRHFCYDSYTAQDPSSGITGGFTHYAVHPDAQTEYYTPGILWSSLTCVGLSGRPNSAEAADESSVPTAYRAGTDTATTWGAAPFGPTLPIATSDPQDGRPLPSAYRQGNKIYTTIDPIGSDDPRHVLLPTDPRADTGTTSLYRGSRLIDRSDVAGTAGFTLPARRGRYRLVINASRRDAAWPLTTHVHVAWSFTSRHTDADRRSALPLLSARFHLPLDQYDRAQVGQPIRGNVMVTHQSGARARVVTGVHVWVSYDNGKTWRAAHTAATTGSRTLQLPAAPHSARFASLRLSARDASGNTLTETIDHAFAVH